MEHLDEMALEALATDRDDLVGEDALAHLDECERCAERVALERMAVEDASLALERVLPDLDVDAMVARAMEHAPDPALGREPSRRSLWMGAALGGVAAIGLGVLSLPGAEAVNGLGTAGSQLYTVARALDRVVVSGVPGGWAMLAGLGLVLGLMMVVPARMLLGSRPFRPTGPVTSMLALALLGAVSVPSSLAHAYRVDGQWPEPQPRVTVDVEQQPTTEALRQAAQSAGLGVVVRLDEDPPVTLHVQDAPIGEVIEALLGTSDVVVRPGASLINVRPDDAPPPAPEPPPEQAEVAPEPPPAPAAPRAPPTPRRASEVQDRVTFGGNVVIGPDEEVRDVVTMGGNATVRGRAFGDVVTMGGNADLTGEVIGNVITMGGNIRVADGATVHGDLNAMGGNVDVADGATVHGPVVSASDAGDRHLASTRQHDHDGEGGFSGLFRRALWYVLLFLFGLFLMGAYRKRFTNLQAALAERPVRNAFGGFFGGLAAMIICGVLTVTIIGIPGAMVLGTLLVVGVGVGWTTSAWWLGSVMPIAFIKDRPVLQLALGLTLLFLLGTVPVIGGLAVFCSVLAGLGAVISTSFGQRGTLKKKPKFVATGPFAGR